MLLLVCVSMILLFSEMPVWAKGLSLTFMGCLIAYQRLWQQSSARLVQLIQFDKTTWRWTVLENPRHQKNTTHEGRLIHARGGWFVLALTLETTIKNKTQTKSWVIWRDQVDADHWRRLVVMTRFWADDVGVANDPSF